MDQLADDGPKTENPEEQEQGSSQTRPYECTFCRRGFSNAQALGGHMNIHRKDKAKLRQSEKTNQQQQLLEKPMFFPSLSTKPDIGQLKPSAPSAGAPAGLVSNTKWPPWIVREKFPDAKIIGKGKEVQQLALFEEKPFGKEEEIRSLDQVTGDRHKAGPGACQSSMELDLELRLGPEPYYCSSTTPISTKKFF